MASDGPKDVGEELREQLRDLIRVMRPLRHQVTQGQLVAVSPAMLSVLATIAKISDAHADGGCHSKDLAERFAVNPSTISRAVAALVRLGLVERSTDPADKRAHFLALTDAGQAVLAAADGWYDELFRAAFKNWNPEDVAAFTVLLRRFTEDLEVFIDHPLHCPPPPTLPPGSLPAQRAPAQSPPAPLPQSPPSPPLPPEPTIVESTR